MHVIYYARLNLWGIQRLRHPSRLKGKYLTMDQFVRYISTHLQEHVSREWTADVDSASALEAVARYCPEILREKASSAHFDSWGARPLTFGELKEVPELAEFARRMVKLNLRKQQTWSSESSARGAIKPIIDPAKYDRTYDKAFRTAIRSLCKSGDIVECDLQEADIRQVCAAKRKRENAAANTSPIPTSKRRTLRDVSNLCGSASSLEEEEIVEIERTGYLPLTLPVLGPILLNILRAEVAARKLKYFPKGDPRRDNGVTVSDIAARLKKLANRWDRLPLTIIEDGLSDLMDGSLVQVWGVGFWPAEETITM